MASVLVAATGHASIIYYDNTNPANDTLTDTVYSAGPYAGIGDSITLAGAGLGATGALAEFYNDGSAGTFDATLQFFAAGSPVGAPIGSTFTLAGINVGSNAYADVDFQLGGLNLPANIVFILGVANVEDGVDPGVELYSGPAGVGSNTQDSQIILQDGGYTEGTTGQGGGNPYFELSAAVPEPSTWLLAAAGLYVALRRVRRKPIVERSCVFGRLRRSSSSSPDPRAQWLLVRVSKQQRQQR
jgi:PEP-CTERM motif-containing protein